MPASRRPHRTAPVAAALALLGLLAGAPGLAHDDSRAHREAAARIGGWDAVARALAGAARLREDGDVAGAREALAAARAASGRDPRVAAFAALLALDAGAHREADSLASRAIAEGDATLANAARLTRARARAALGESDGSLADFDAAIAAAQGRDEELVCERARAAAALAGPAAALAALEAATPAGRWTPARRTLAASFERALGSAPRAREGTPAIERPSARGPAAPAAAAAADDTLLRAGSAWRWYAGPAAPAGAWTAAGYDDSAWGSGPAPLGYGETRIATTVPYGGNAALKWVTTYLRASFTRPAGAAEVLSAILRADYDDGFIAYVNGVEVARRGLPTGAVTWGTYAANHESGVFENIAFGAAGLFAEGPNVLAVELHQQSAGSSDLLWDAALLADTTTVTRTRGPYLQNATPGAVSVRWRTAAPVVGRVSIGPAGGPYAWTFDEPAAGTEHEVRVTGLAPETAYAYAVHGAGEPPEPVSGARTFRTPPAPGADRPVRIWAIGDSGLDTPGGRAVRDAYLAWSGARREDLWLLLGDNAYDTGTDAQYQAGLFDPYAPLLARSPLWSTRGNHDYVHAGLANDYYDLFTLPAAGEGGGLPSGTEAWYAFDWGPVHFVCLDSEGSSRALDSPMLEWLRADLAATTQPWVIGFWHHPPYTKGSHDSDDPADSGGRMRDMRERVLPILDSLGVDLVLTGHSHSYERSMLLRGHYGLSGTLVAAMLADSGDGRAGGDGAYVKAPGSPGANEGAVYAVNGSAVQTGGGTLDHPAMVSSLDVLGSMVVDVAGGRLDARFLDHLGAVRDSFTILKGGALAAGPGTEGGLALAAPRPSPFRDRSEFAFTLPRAGQAVLTVFDVGGRRVRTLASGPHAAGAHRIAWDGRDGRGARVAPGAYLVLLEAGGERRMRRIVRLP